MLKRTYNHAKVEKKWQKEWQETRLYEPDFARAKNPFYNLMMFPYPSAEGLHVGNVYAFTGADIYGRYKRMQGHEVFEPIGLDGFGIHSENYALKVGVHPERQAKISEKRFYKQLESIGNGFAWNERVETYNPEYYQWTQWLFIQLFKAGLAYRKKAEVNWCTSCLTVLADEQVIRRDSPESKAQNPESSCERCGSAVIKKELEQWFLKITDYAERLLKNVDTLDWSEKVKIAQKNWIGKSKGICIAFRVEGFGDSDNEYIEIFTTRPDTIMSITFIALAPNHPLAKIQNGKAIHPITGEELPMVVVDYVMGDYGTGAVMGVPAYDERDREYAEKNNLPIVKKPLMSVDEAVRKSGGKKITKYRLRDWLISRQRYWGPPIPLIFCESCHKKLMENPNIQIPNPKLTKGEIENPGWMSVEDADLPVLLPKIKNFRPTGTGQSPLASVKKFYETECPKCGGKARRETDVSDTFLDSSWYYLAYIVLNNKKINPLNPKLFTLSPLIKKWLPVARYIGGAEHSVLHLLYARFIAMALYDMGHIDFEEPFTTFRAHGLLIKDGAKMSKSKGNVINPDDHIVRFGADTVRMYLMFLAPFEAGGDFRDEAVMGIYRFLNRVWNIGYRIGRLGDSDSKKNQLLKISHQTIKKVTEDIEKLHYNTAISALMMLLRSIEEAPEKVVFKTFLQLLAPFAPHITEELWRALGEKKSIHISSWPKHDEALMAEGTFNLVVQINGKMRATVKVEKGIHQNIAEKIARENDMIQKWLAEKPVTRIIFIPDQLINFII